RSPLSCRRARCAARLSTFFFSSRRRHTRFSRDWSSDVCSSDLDSLKKERTRQQGILNAIQARIDQVKKRNEQFKEQVKLVELQMEKIKGELHGSASGKARQIGDNVNPPSKSLPPK